MTMDELLKALDELDQEITATTAQFEKNVTEIRGKLNEEFAAADKALNDFVDELGRTDDLEAEGDEVSTK